ncbi:MAG TPA: hypothetical protein VNX21_06585, partial [Candidatus Thermoplasmatota archaeon]|nr:hypothetical protein [Candidatus Thermoplasmatota archaeon]
MGGKLVAALAVALLGAAGAAIADVNVDTPLAGVEARNSFGADCHPRPADQCVADVRGDGTPGGTTVDAFQRVQYVGVAPNGSAPLAWLLPDESVVVRGDDVYVQNPFLPFLTQAYNAHPRETPASDRADLRLSSSNASVMVHGPLAENATGAWGHRAYGYEYTTNGRSLGYDHVGPFNMPAGHDVDENMPGTANLTCLFVGDDPGCYAAF